MKIAIVDDDQALGQRLQESLSLAGHEVHVFHQAESALRSSAGLKPDVFLIDLIMPGKSGLELASELLDRPEFAETPVVAMFEFYAESQHRRLFEEIGIRACVKKPFSPAEVLAVLERLQAGTGMAPRLRGGPGGGKDACEGAARVQADGTKRSAEETCSTVHASCPVKEKTARGSAPAACERDS